MKRMNGHRNRFLTAGTRAALLSGLLLFSCNNDELIDLGGNHAGRESDQICFGVGDADSVRTRAVTDAPREHTVAHFVLRSPDSPDTLCVRAIVTDGIDAPDGQRATRATPITSLEDHGGFHVQAYCWDSGTSTGQFYMDTDVDRLDGGVWSTSDHVYYWPGEGRTLSFYAWAPKDAFPTPDYQNQTLSYTVLDEVADQKDLVVAKRESVQGNFNQQLPLDFKHICTAVKFVVGSQMQPGTIQSVSLKGVTASGTYDMATDKWTLTDDATADFSQTLEKATTGTEADGTAITSDDATFMMLPQTLPDGATVEVVFRDNTTGQDRILTASIASSEWPQGKTVTYKLSITPEYNFELTETPVLDAHYEILKTTLKVTGISDGQQWTVTAPTLDGNAITIQAQSEMNNYALQGYWTDRNINSSGDDTGSARGDQTYEGRGSGDFPIAIFIPENVDENGLERKVELSVLLTDEFGNQMPIAKTLSLTQLAPSWYGESIGCERIESSPSPWGFYWTDDFKLIYDLRNCDRNSRENVRQYVEWTKALHTLTNIPFLGLLFQWIFGDDIPDISFVEMEKSGAILGFGGIADVVTINLGGLETSGIATSADDGQSNTREIYNFEGIQLVNQIISMVQSISGCTLTTEGEGINPTNNAAIACMKLNSWNIVDTGNEDLLKLTNTNDIPDWYLPASGEVSGINDDKNPLKGEYWTSTGASTGNTQAYMYDAGGNTGLDDRNKEHNIRAVRQKP